MQTSFKELGSKKGDKIYLVGNWNGYEKEVIKFYICPWTVSACGKKITRLTSPGGNAKRDKYTDYTTEIIDGTKTVDQAVEEAVEYVRDQIYKEEERLQGYLDNFAKNTLNTSQHWYKGIQDRLAYLHHKPVQILVFDRWYTTGESQVSKVVDLLPQHWTPETI